jgi:2-oxoglutarate dehydrogenase complex, dehydrogenase (E1) component, and related enzymes
MHKIQEIGFQNLNFVADLLESRLGSFFGEIQEDLFHAHPDLRLFNLVLAWRNYGHLKAHLSPIETRRHIEVPELDLARFGFKPSDLKRSFSTEGLLPAKEAALSDVIAHLEKVYGGVVGIEYMGLDALEMERWLQGQLEKIGFTRPVSIEAKRKILTSLNEAELFETFLHTRYVGQKRFSLEGAETLIPMLHAVIDRLADMGAETIVIGMAHRGRLNVLSNILGKSYREIFSEFQDVPHDTFEGSGDVKYHKGYRAEIQTKQGKKLEVILAPNPSHLEAVDPVVEGEVRARQSKVTAVDPTRVVVPILIHGDAALAGQGVVFETMQMGKLEGYKTGGTIHLVINNKIGFTTLPEEGRSTTYCTGIAAAFGSPVFHVNAEYPEEAVFASLLATEVRQRFVTDVFIDLNCYRKYGHNESDEPAYTQPLEYKLIRQKQSIRELYRDQLIQHGLLEQKLAVELEEQFKDELKKAMELVVPVRDHIQKVERQFPKFEPIATGVPKATLISIAEKLAEFPDSFILTLKSLRCFEIA